MSLLLFLNDLLNKDECEMINTGSVNTYKSLCKRHCATKYIYIGTKPGTYILYLQWAHIF